MDERTQKINIARRVHREEDRAANPNAGEGPDPASEIPTQRLDRTPPTRTLLRSPTAPPDRERPTLAQIEAELGDKFRIVKLLGEGGMGMVFLAEQQGPVKRNTALKIIRSGLYCQDTLARFETERQALALMNHKHVAKIYNGGATRKGRPYFVMEYFDGEPITQHCRQCRAAIDKRLDLFLKVCDGVRHAHQKGVIHRDLKPSNVLVVLEHDEPSPRIIDFGIAIAVDYRFSDRDDDAMGTPAYMSPEQIAGRGADTRSDVYSLGVLLYELLTGRLPIDADSPQALAPKIIHQTPPPPSACADDPDAAKHAAELRTTPRALCQTLRGELDAIVMKALAKDPAERYASAVELADDLRRYFRAEPVSAHAAGRSRFFKLARRHRNLAFAAFLALTALVLAATAIAAAWTRLADVRESVRLAEISAERDRAAALAVRRAFVDAMSSDRVDMASALESAAASRRQADAGRPAALAAALHALGAALLDLGKPERAAPLLAEALTLRQTWLGQDHPATRDSARLHARASGSP